MFRFVQDSSKWPKHKHTLEKNWHAVDMHRLQDCSFLKPEDPKLLFSTRGFFLLLFQKFYFETKWKTDKGTFVWPFRRTARFRTKKCLRRSLIFKALTSKKSKNMWSSPTSKTVSKHKKRIQWKVRRTRPSPMERRKKTVGCLHFFWNPAQTAWTTFITRVGLDVQKITAHEKATSKPTRSLEWRMRQKQTLQTKQTGVCRSV